MACSTPQVRTEAVDPVLSFPNFPDPFDADGRPIPRLEGGSVVVPQFYWIWITEYVIEVEKTREMYEAWKDVYFGEG